jgi:hypothetical protein
MKIIPQETPELSARFWSKVDKTGDCWIWTASKTREGYGSINIGGTLFRAHRVSWAWANGPIPDGLEMDHKCKNQSCVRIEHLEPVTHRENVLRGRGLAAINAAKTHCIKGHEFTPSNTCLRPNGKRYCRVCNQEHTRQWGATHRGAPRI